MEKSAQTTTLRQKAKLAVGCKRYTLKSGLTVLCAPMPGYSTTYAMYATPFGSVIRDFTLDGKPVHLPAGTAHFLEHKMFESEQGDAFDAYAKTGASANAFTSYERTCYLFSATGEVDKNLDILLNMVGKPYFTKKTIAKEQGIIGQEIKMYDDNPDWRLLTGLFQCLYRSHPVRDDIAGTVESIAELTPELLYACTDAFYSPANMVLAVAGNAAPEQVLAACRRAGLDAPAHPHTVRYSFAPETGPLPRTEMKFSMPVNKPCFALGYRLAPIVPGDARREILCDMLPELICGGLTPLYRKLYDEALVNPEFSGEAVAAQGCCALAFTGESETPRAVAELVKAEIARQLKEGVDAELFGLVKNQIYGDLLADLESADDAAEALLFAQLKGYTLEGKIEALAELTVQDADAALHEAFDGAESAYVEIEPQE